MAIIKKRQRNEGHPGKGKMMELVQSTDEATKRLNVEIPISVHRALKVKASSEGKTIKELMMALFDEYLKDAK